MKLDRDGSGTIDKDEFLLIPQIANNPLASRMIAIFDEECVSPRPRLSSPSERLAWSGWRWEAGRKRGAALLANPQLTR